MTFLYGRMVSYGFDLVFFIAEAKKPPPTPAKKQASGKNETAGVAE